MAIETKRDLDAALAAAHRAAVLFTADWCYPCIRFKPHFAAIDTGPWTKVVVDVSEDASPLWDEHHVRVVPTVVFFQDGRETHRIAGALRPEDLTKAVAALPA